MSAAYPEWDVGSVKLWGARWTDVGWPCIWLRRKTKSKRKKPNPMRPALSFHADRYRANDPDRKFTMSAVWVIYGHAFWHKRFGASIVWR